MEEYKIIIISLFFSFVEIIINHRQPETKEQIP